MIDNFDLIRPLLSFRSDDDFYFLQILQRKKDHKEGGNVKGSNNNSRLIKAYYIHSLEYFDFIKPEVIELCNIFNARAGINLNRRSYEKMCLQLLRKVTDQILNKSYDKAHKAYPSVAGAYQHESDKTWILDIDNINFDQKNIDLNIHGILIRLEDIEPLGDKFIKLIPSKSGCHVLVKPFNIMKAKPMLDKWKIEVHKNNPTNLYIP